MKKVKRMMFGGFTKAVGNAAKNAAAKAPAPTKPNPMGGMFGRMAANSAPAPAPAPAPTNPKIPAMVGTMLSEMKGLGVKPTVTGAPDKNLPFTINNKPTPNVMGLGTAAQANPRIPASVQNAISNLKAGNIPKARPGSMVGQRFGGMGMKEGGKVSSASKRADGCAVKGKTKGKMV
jgi:hypothetical protein